MTPHALVDLLLHKSFFAYFFGSFVGMVTIANPLSKFALFTSLTSSMPREVRLSNARRACLYAFAMIVVLLFAGGYIMEAFGISYGALRIAGGITVGLMGYRMLFAPGEAPVPPRPGTEDVAFFPLAFPGIAGPGMIALAIGISSEIAEIRSVATKSIAYGATVLSAAAVCMVIWLVFRSSRPFTRLVGEQGMDAITRLMGFMLICIGVQFIGSGIRTFIAGS